MKGVIPSSAKGEEGKEKIGMRKRRGNRDEGWDREKERDRGRKDV